MPLSAFSISSTNSMHGAIASAIRSAWRTFCSDWPTNEPNKPPTSSTSVGRPVSLPRLFANADLPQPGGESNKHAAGTSQGGPLLRLSERTHTKRFQRLQAAQVAERFLTLVEREQSAFLEHLALLLEHHGRLNPPMPHQRQRKGVLGLVAGQASGRIEHRVDRLLRQFAGLRGHAAGNLGQLFAARQIVFDHDEQLFQFGRDLHDGRQDHHERAILFALADLMGQSLDDLGRIQEPMEIDEHQ